MSRPTQEPISTLRVLFVCLGNICRSPLAEGVFRQAIAEAGLTGKVECDSAGTAGWHAGKAPDRRSVAVAAQNGVDISALRARQVTRQDFDAFDLILGMDGDNVADLKRLAPSQARAEIALFHHHARGIADDVPDPYYGEASDFEAVYRSIRMSCEAMAGRLSDTVRG